MIQTLSPATAAIVRATAPAIAGHGIAIAAVTLARLRDRTAVEGNRIWRDEAGVQTHALAAVLFSFAQNIENLKMLVPAFERIASKHAIGRTLSEVLPEAISSLVVSMKEVLAERATDEVLHAWHEALLSFVSMMKARHVDLPAGAAVVERQPCSAQRFAVAANVHVAGLFAPALIQPEVANWRNGANLR